ncbi:glycosyltransferase [Bradyrhizobium roseum]|uniref:glycosyltransferase n=1 Tax=Bradyrhizobium roseum TaxID=3056648 RepID=UPI00262DF830|nr:glycosyltransferase [Bradyrhizobium roseus]WKA30565.1 glycosyltransferase [Bradyrhizobium roseus]
MAEVKSGGEAIVEVSVIIANHNGEKFIADAVRSACRQTLRNIEIIVSDDASTDTSVKIVEGLMAEDCRIRLVRSDVNGGPAAARNRALDIARGEWISILDGDDLMHPGRLQSIIDQASKSGADIAADDLLLFDAGRQASPQTLFSGRWAKSPQWVSPEEYVRTNNPYGTGPALGYLKPVIRSSVIAQHKLRYDERLTIAEDYDFIFRLLMAGAKFLTLPQIGYFYRRHSGSVSHRLSSDALQRIADAEAGWEKRWPQASLQGALRARERSIRRAITFDRLVLQIKAGQMAAAVRTAMADPAAALLLHMPAWQFIKRLGRTRDKTTSEGRRQICILTRQRIVGRTNGSSRYLLDIAAYLAEQGAGVHLVVPSPITMGRLPFLKLSDDMAFFSSIRFRGTVRVGRYIVACDPRIGVKSALGVVDRLLYRKGVTARLMFSPAPYAISQPLTRKDQLFIAQAAPSVGDVLIADYCFLTDAFPYALRPDARRLVIMHDLFSSRSSQFDSLNASDSVASILLAEEVQMLAAADTIVAIQRDEAEVLRGKLPGHEILVAPIAALPVKQPQPGGADTVLFVGSSAAPNVDGIKWFIDACWPSIRQQRPDAALNIAGSVCSGLARVPDGVRLLNVVDDLDDLYAEAAVVISPLRAGSGLKIKLIEALSKGKAVVATTTTLQGVADIMNGCAAISDNAPDFAADVVKLLADDKLRSELGARGLSVISRHFAPDSAYGGISAAAGQIAGPGIEFHASRV